MKLTITMIVLMRSIPPFIAIVDSVYAMLVLGLNCNGLLCTLRLLKYELRMLWSLLTPALRCSCSPTQLVVFIIQQESVEYSIYLFILLCDQC